MPDLCTSQSISGVIKYRITIWAGRVSRMAQARNAYGFFGSKA